MELGTRERKLVIFLGIFLGIVVLYNLILAPFLEQKRTIDNKLVQLQKDIKTIEALAERYKEIKNEQSLSKKKFVNFDKNFNLFSFLEKMASSAGIKENINSMKPSTISNPQDDYQISQVVMKLQDITMQKLISFLYMVEASQNAVFVKRFSINQKGKENKTLEVFLLVESINQK